MGVARDIVPEKGIEHMSRFGRFDEMIAGMGWRNTGLAKYVYGELPGPAATPQVIVTTRSTMLEGGQ